MHRMIDCLLSFVTTLNIQVQSYHKTSLIYFRNDRKLMYHYWFSAPQSVTVRTLMIMSVTVRLLMIMFFDNSRISTT